MHTLQKLLVQRLVHENGRTFASLTKGYDAEDNIVFHLKQLISNGFVEKRSEKYFITAQGIKTLNTFQKTDLQDNAFKMFFAGFVCKCDEQYLIKPHTNAKTTFYNLPSGSPLFAEDLEQALPRIFYDETDLWTSYANFKFDSLHMKTVKTIDGEILFDDAFGIYKIEVNPKQKDQMKLKKGCVWMTLSEISKLGSKWPEIDHCVLSKEWSIYKKYDVICDYILQ